MKFKRLVSLLTLFAFSAQSAHINDRSIYATEIKNANGTPVFNFPASLPTANRVCTFNGDSEPVAGTSSAVTAMLDNFLGDSGSGGTKGLVPAPAAGDAAAGKFLKADGTWATVSGGGGGGTPGGANTQIQYNSSGTFAGSSGLVWDNANSRQTVTKNSIGNNYNPGLSLLNTTAATSGTQQNSPGLRLGGRSWLTNSTASTTTDWLLDNKAGSGLTSLGTFRLAYSSNAGSSWSDIFNVTQGGAFTLFGNQEIKVNNSSNPTFGTEHLTLTNTSGATTNIVFKFGSTSKAAITSDSFGNRSNYGLLHSFFVGNTLSSQIQIAQIFSNGFYTNYGGFFGGKVTAGSANTNPPATLTNFGSEANTGKIITADYSPSGTEKFIYCDTSSAFNCTGTPATSCGSLTSQGSCDAKSALGCGWQVQGDCSNANSTDYSTCIGQNAACSWERADCSAFNDNMSGCQSAGFPSGGQCSFTPASCSNFSSDPSTCNSASGCSVSFGGNCADFNDIPSCDAHGGALGCTTSTGDCNSFSDGGGDGSACTPNGCSYDSGSGVCSGNYLSSCTGSYFTSCDGTYQGSNGTCSGSFDTSNCIGGSFGSCLGSSQCSNLTASGESVCGAESGCSWVSGLTVTLPAISTKTVGSASSFTSWYLGIKKKNAGAGSVIVKVASGSGDTISYGASSSSLASQGDEIRLHAMTYQADCSAFNNNQGACTPSGCSFTLTTCSGNDEGTCGTLSGCSWDGSQCTGEYSGSNGSCSGTYTTERIWEKW